MQGRAFLILLVQPHRFSRGDQSAPGGATPAAGANPDEPARRP